MNIGDLTGYVGLNVDELTASAARGERDIASLTQRVIAEAQRIENERLKVKLDADASAAERAIADVQRDLDEIRARPASARVDGDTRDAEARLADLQLQLARINSQRIRVRVDIDTSGADRARISADQLRSQLNGAAAAALALGGGVPMIAALGAALASAVAASAILPSLLGAIGAGVATIGVGFGGIGEAIGAMSAADTAGGGAASAAGAQREAAMERVRSAQDALAGAQEQAARQAITGAQQIADAQDGVEEAVQDAARAAVEGARQISDAQRAVADAVEAAASRVESAEASLERSQASATSAQEALTRAREDAKEAIEDLALSLSGAALSEEAANLRLLRAQENLKKAGTNKNSLAYKEAELGVRQAAQAVAEATDRYGDLKEESAKSAQQGVDGSDQVVAAQKRVNDANQQVVDSQKALDKARTDGARQVQDAQQRLADVTDQVAQRQADAAATVAQAKESLARTEQQVAWAQQDAAKQVADAQRQVAEAIKASSASAAGGAGGVDKYAQALAKLSPAGRELVQMLAQLRPQWEALQKDVQQRLLTGVAEEIGELATIYLPLLNDLLGRTADSFNRAFMETSAMLQTKEASDQVRTGIDNVNAAIDIWSGSIAPLTQLLLDLFSVGSEFLPGMAQGWTDNITAARDFISEAARSGELKVWIQDALDVLGQLWTILSNIGGIIGAVFGAGAESGSGFLQFLADATGAVRAFLEQDGVQAFLAGFFQVLTDLAPTLLALAAAFKIAAIAVGIFNAIAALNPVGLIIAAIIALVIIIVTNWDMIVAYTQQTWDNLIAGLTIAWEWIKSAVAAAAQFLVDLFLNWTLLGIIIKHWDDIQAGIGAAWDWIGARVQDGVRLVESILAWFGELPGKFSDWFGQAKDAAIAKALELATWLVGLPGRFLSALGNLGSLLVNTGRDIISGLWEGILSLGPWLADQVMGFIRSFVPGPVLQFLGIASPSKYFRDQIGRWIPEGLADGIIGNASVAGDAARMMAAEAAQAAQDTASAGMVLAEGDIARIEAYANQATAGARERVGMAMGRAQDAVTKAGATINIYNPQAERASDSLNSKARTLEALGVL